jgi:hypothetical protein
MSIVLSETAANAMLDELSRIMDGGSIEFQAGDGKLLVVLQLPDPATMGAVDGELEFRTIASSRAHARGNAVVARIIGGDGSEVFVCDVGDRNSDAVIKVSRTQFDRDDPVSLDSFRLVMP